MKRMVLIPFLAAFLLPAPVTATPPGQTVTAPYYDMFRERQWCGSTTAICDINDNARTSDGALENSFEIVGRALDETTPVQQVMSVGFWMPIELPPINDKHPRVVTATFHVDAAHLEVQTSDGSVASSARGSLWGSAKHSACRCVISSPSGGLPPSIEIISSADGSEVTIPEQDVVLRFPLADIPGGHLPAGHVEIKIGLRTEAVLRGTGHIAGSIRGSLTAVSIK